MPSLVTEAKGSVDIGAATERSSQAGRPIIAFFGHDSAESTVIKRALAFQANGARVIGFMFRRERDGRNATPGWENIPLGTTVDRNYIVRLPTLLLGVVKAVWHGATLRRCDVIYVRNLDMLFVAVVAKILSGAKARIAYEVLDVRRIFLGQAFANRAFRWAERRLMAASALLVVSAPDFITQYFAPVQGFRGQWFLLENKLAAGALAPGLLDAAKPLPPGPPWVIGMFGVLRCARSMNILCTLADRLGEKVVIYLRGIPSETDIPTETIMAACRLYPNVVFEGPYTNPSDLPEIYNKIHFIWASDFLDPGGNSDWCLTNRLYEGGIMRAVMIAASGHATGRMVEREGLGVSLDEPLLESAMAFFQELTAETYEQLRKKASGASESLFIDCDDTKRLVDLLGKLN